MLKTTFATSVETFPDLILEMLCKAIKNKKVKVKLPDNVEKDETTQTSNTRNSKTVAVGSMILYTKVVDLSKIYNNHASDGVFLVTRFLLYFLIVQ